MTRLPDWLIDLHQMPDDPTRGGHLTPESARRSLARWNRVLDGYTSFTDACDEEDEDEA